MKQTLLASAGALALLASPALAQQNADPAAPEPQSDAGMTTKETSGPSADAPRANNPVRRQVQAGGGPENKDGPVRDAVGDPPVAPSPMGQRQAQAENARQAGWGEEIPFPPQDVSDSDIETFGPRDIPYPGKFPDRDSPQDRPASVGDNPDVVQEDEQVPEDIERIQRAERWNDAELPGGDHGSAALPDRGNVPGPDMRSAERGPASAWDGRGVGREFDRGRLHSERSPSSDDAARRQSNNATTEQDLSGDPQLALARTALATAKTIAPEISFSTYRFEVEDRERLIEIAGQDPDNGRRIEVDVYPDGRVESVAQQVPLTAVPVEVQTLVSMGIPGFQPARALRSMGRGLELQYEIDGYSSDNRPISVRVEPNGTAMLVTVWNG